MGAGIKYLMFFSFLVGTGIYMYSAEKKMKPGPEKEAQVPQIQVPSKDYTQVEKTDSFGLEKNTGFVQPPPTNMVYYEHDESHREEENPIYKDRENYQREDKTAFLPEEKDKRIVIHIARPGDTFYSLASLYYGDIRKQKIIIQENPEIHPQYIPVGAPIKIPNPTKKKSSPAPKARKKKLPTTHIVEQGDTLYGLAIHYYGDFQKWLLIKEANPDVDVMKLQEGDKLLIPRVRDGR